MKLKNVGPRTVTIQGVGVWEADEVREVHDPEVAEGLLRNDFFEEVGPRGGSLRPEPREERPTPVAPKAETAPGAPKPSEPPPG